MTNSVYHDIIGCEHRSGTRSQKMSGSKLNFPSSFYGLLDILSGTELNSGQRETGRYNTCVSRRESNPSPVQTAKESCELLLKVVNVDSDKHDRGISWFRAQIIDSILDYSKLEALGGFASLRRVREVDGILSAVKLDSSAFSIENIVAVCLQFPF